MSTTHHPPDNLRRLDALRALLAEHGLDAALLHTLPSRRYYCGFTGDSGFLLVTATDAALYTDGRYTTQAADEVPPAVAVIRADVFAAGARRLAEMKIPRLGYEEDTLPIARFRELEDALASTALVAARELIMAPRLIKDAGEQELIREAVDIAEAAYAEVLPLVKPGVGERDIAVELEYHMRRLGAEDRAFDIIVASGSRGALPHGIAGARPLSPGDAVTIDFGARRHGYHSDQTCTVFLGEPSAEQERVYRAVYAAQQAGIAAARPGMAAAALDAVVRDHLAAAGLTAEFSHGTGHGVGLEIHEPPSISGRGDTILAAGMVFTIEPGCYFPHRWGVRLEDMVILEAGGGRRLTTLDKRLETAVLPD
ncbi:MAG: aminopeptidase P family protein [Deltaproteobacteria bacterium]|nr:aminopeptidase P family protein [Candidatus Anaeroferrophillacea bacterium]